MSAYNISLQTKQVKPTCVVDMCGHSSLDPTHIKNYILSLVGMGSGTEGCGSRHMKITIEKLENYDSDIFVNDQLQKLADSEELGIEYPKLNLVKDNKMVYELFLRDSAASRNCDVVGATVQMKIHKAKFSPGVSRGPTCRHKNETMITQRDNMSLTSIKAANPIYIRTMPTEWGRHFRFRPSNGLHSSNSVEPQPRYIIQGSPPTICWNRPVASNNHRTLGSDPRAGTGKELKNAVPLGERLDMWACDPLSEYRL